ncbi:MAG: fluoride efflux transporter CrcB [Alicyclobacillus sp.]|nr:fluoride efflux transporter CrcB [Alicyclobacillus sp.]
MPYLAVAIGGLLGACARYAVSEWVGTYQGFPVATLLINLSGCFVLAWFYTITLERLTVHPLFRLGAGTGFIGAFTTYSTFTVETWKLVQAGAWTAAAGYLLASLVGGLLAGWAGYLAAAREARLPLAESAGEELDT